MISVDSFCCCCCVGPSSENAAKQAWKRLQDTQESMRSGMLAKVRLCNDATQLN